MTSGKLNTSRTLVCIVCNSEITWNGGRPKKYCSQKCIQQAYEYRKNPNRKPRNPNHPKLTKAQYARHRRRQHKQITDEAKLDAIKCHDCELRITEDTLPCFAFDHRNPRNKSFTISQVLGRTSTEKLIEEIAKCDVVCHNCHALRTHKQRNEQ